MDLNFERPEVINSAHFSDNKNTCIKVLSCVLYLRINIPKTATAQKLNQVAEVEDRSYFMIFTCAIFGHRFIYVEY